MTKALVLGAGGHIGNAICREFQQQGYAVTGVIRGTRFYPNLLDLDTELIQLDIDTSESLGQLIGKNDWVVDAAAPYLQSFFASEVMLQDAENRMRRLLDNVAASGAGFVYISSHVTLDGEYTTPRKLSSKYLTKLHPYYVMKSRLENMVFQYGAKGLRFLVLNPSVCLGPWDCKALHNCFVPRTISGDIPVIIESGINIVDVRDLASFLAKRLREGDVGKRYPVFGLNILYSDLVAEICDYAGVDMPARSPLPHWIGNIASLGFQSGAVGCFNTTLFLFLAASIDRRLKFGQ
ncbi:MAG: NAD-dependent epimerase/dehydratase family protein [Pseudomonadales bacterium]|jgi:nucleoside-diphosphate-sugar epimerase|nr:NAD-dependent epimerase/dehydratase family protein [Pseudomonadales bacterium]MDP7597027.1 NAD-dependent epimerase/dehydratase family protein [Pseudomonadales bacterium]HJN52230.1 NAD-dependent epimerase/dehydratase family protein [Pseudomonadales bacterium]